ncbi:hypothetical protein [Streptomyces roseolus]|uniref:hypothetical protein n=1 Tax=Streptomyces roseolus TaxID=67358 RepID=UPI00167BC3A9|nr:hypothetical protein [Streptomyces roseolus]GGR38998.1 hypothetical protein GCM10010282_34620 [Streptomyces roseolus]
MVTSSHEASHRIFQDRPELLSPVFRVLGLRLPPTAAVEVLTPSPRVDSVLRISPSEGPGFLLAIEAQGRRDPERASSWTYHLAHLRAKYDIPALLLVVCQDRATARWAAGPFVTGVDGWTALRTHPLVLGPDNVPVITDPEEVRRSLALAVFSAMAHARDPDCSSTLEGLAQALATAEPDSVAYCSELLEIGLGDTPARKTWRHLMRTVGTFFPGRGTLVEETYLKGKAEGEAEGRAEGLAEAVLRVLRARGIDVPEAVAGRVTAVTDPDELGRLLDRSVAVASAGELFDAA